MSVRCYGAVTAGPITRAAQEGGGDTAVAGAASPPDLTQPNSSSGLQFDTQPLVNILAGVAAAILVVFLVIIVTLRIRYPHNIYRKK